MRSVITNRQMFFILILTITGYSLISMPGDAIRAADTGAWFTILLLTLIFMIGILIITSLNKKFEGMTIFEYSTIIVGKPVAWVITFISAIYFFIILVSLSRNVGEFIKSNYLPLTPVWALIFIFLGLSLYIAFKGITNIGRLVELYGILFIIISLSIHAIMFFLGDMTYVQPFFEPSKLNQYVWGAKDLFVAFLGIEVLTLIPFGKSNKKNGVLTGILSILYIGVFYIIIVETSTMIIGINEVTNYHDSLIEALRITKLPSTILLQRADFIFITLGVLGIISCLSVLSFSAIESTTKLIPKAKRGLMFIILGIVIYIISCFCIDVDMANFLFINVVGFVGVFVAFIVPITLFIIAKVRKL